MTIECWSYWDFGVKLHRNDCTDLGSIWWADSCIFKALCISSGCSLASEQWLSFSDMLIVYHNQMNTVEWYVGGITGWTMQNDWMHRDAVWWVHSFGWKAQCTKFIMLDSTLYYCFVQLSLLNLHVLCSNLAMQPFSTYFEISCSSLLLYYL